MFDVLQIARALSDENRLRILMALRGRELCVCQVTAFLDLAPSTTSKHLSILRQSRLIESCKQGRWVYYRLADAGMAVSGVAAPASTAISPSLSPPSPVVCAALDWLRQSLAAEAHILQDEIHIAALLKAEAESGLAADAAHCHSPELHMLDQDIRSGKLEEENYD